MQVGYQVERRRTCSELRTKLGDALEVVFEGGVPTVNGACSAIAPGGANRRLPRAVTSVRQCIPQNLLGDIRKSSLNYA